MVKINNNISYRSPSFCGLNIGPRGTRILDKVGAMRSPGQRLIFGVAALGLQPVIDKTNPWVDKKTRETSSIRSIAKAIVSTATGVVIREACIVGTNALLNNKKMASKLPAYMLKDKGHTAGVIGTLAGLGIMMFTNFLIDAPYTNKLTNYLLKKHKSQNDKMQDSQNSDKVQISAPSPSLKTSAETLEKQPAAIPAANIPQLSQVNMEVLKWAS